MAVWKFGDSIGEVHIAGGTREVMGDGGEGCDRFETVLLVGGLRVWE